MKKLVMLSVLALTLSAASAAARPGANPRTYSSHRPVFALLPSHGWRTQRTGAALARSSKPHAPNSAFAGYSAAKGAADITTRFTVPYVVCSKREAAIGPGAFLLGGPLDRVSFNAANIIVGCYHRVATAQEALEVNGVEFDFVHPVQPGDVIVAHLTDSATGQVVVRLRNLNHRRRWAIAERARGFTPDAALVGDWASADAKTGIPIPPPQFNPTTFRSIAVDGRAFGASSPIGFNMASSSNVLQVSTSPLRGSRRDRFTCTRHRPLP